MPPTPSATPTRAAITTGTNINSNSLNAPARRDCTIEGMIVDDITNEFSAPRPASAGTGPRRYTNATNSSPPSKLDSGSSFTPPPPQVRSNNNGSLAITSRSAGDTTQPVNSPTEVCPKPGAAPRSVRITNRETGLPPNVSSTPVTTQLRSPSRLS
jgi:hypothetical protein